ncbi:MAG: redox-sensing transcriptional repressor Rex [Clostridiales bacterium]
MTVKNDFTIIPEPSLRRLPLYYDFLKRLETSDIKFISCTEIAQNLGFNPIQVRKDIEYTEIIGRPKVGYNIKELKLSIKDFLGWNNSKDAFLIGAGHLGIALLGYRGFMNSGINIISAFDNDPKKIDSIFFGKKIFNVSILGQLINRMNIKLCIITVPAPSAQSIVDIAIKSGVKVIWNFAPCILNVPDTIFIKNENLTSSLAILTRKLKDDFK